MTLKNLGTALDYFGYDLPIAGWHKLLKFKQGLGEYYNAKVPENIRNLIFCLGWGVIGIIIRYFYRGMGADKVPNEFSSVYSQYFPYNAADGFAIYMSTLYFAMCVALLIIFYIIPAIYKFLCFLSKFVFEVVVDITY